jgi:hypothetical protein
VAVKRKIKNVLYIRNCNEYSHSLFNVKVKRVLCNIEALQRLFGVCLKFEYKFEHGAPVIEAVSNTVLKSAFRSHAV